ncbi:MAG: hypothetical protein KBD00_03820, partial [Candidatus Peribacteraceae bacterium]|nr:hypothetical protein [Candidatus Peribacteraceae bacterium]
MSDDNLIAIQELIDSAMSSLKTAQSLLRDITGVSDSSRERYSAKATSLGLSAYNAATSKVVEGVFDGQNMVDSNSQTYPIPANYASKSKLVEGDGMKLTITDEGKFIYKQIAPIDRKTIVGVLIQEDGQYKVLADGKAYRILLASITFYRAEVGDQVTILIPKGIDANWGAVEAIIPKHLAEAAAKAVISADGTLVPAKKTRKKKSDDGELSPQMD